MKKVFRNTSILLFLLISISTVSLGQIVTGNVLDNSNSNPISDATVYINGTIIGTSTNTNGVFTLKNVNFPCKLVVSRVGYELKIINLDSYNPERITILLKEKTVHLSEVSIIGKSTRDKNVEIFRKYFLGSDEWSKKIILKNESVLNFKHYTDTVKILNEDFNILNEEMKYVNSGYDDSVIRSRTRKIFSVKATTPVVLDLPTLGYKLSIDLVGFYLVETPKNTICRYLGYYYYQPYNHVSKTAERKFQQNRAEAFNNSREHFCKSLFNNKLMQNGYLLIDKNTEDENLQFVNISNHIVKKDNKEILITGLMGKTLYIYSFFNYANKPIDLTNKKKFNFSSADEFWQNNYNFLNQKSSISFISDTCCIRSDGSILDDNIMFGGKMILKKIDAMIPEIYLQASGK